MSRHAKPKAAVNLDALTGNLATLRAVAGDEMTQAAMNLLREDLKLTPEKLMLIIKREIAPFCHVGQTDEATLRGMKPETLREAKDRGEFAREITGLQIPVKSQNG